MERIDGAQNRWDDRTAERLQTIFSRQLWSFIVNKTVLYILQG